MNDYFSVKNLGFSDFDHPTDIGWMGWSGMGWMNRLKISVFSGDSAPDLGSFGPRRFMEKNMGNLLTSINSNLFCFATESSGLQAVRNVQPAQDLYDQALRPLIVGSKESFAHLMRAMAHGANSKFCYFLF